ncbi:hypothetical protein [Pedobacter rhizosphaerae]|uniref:Fibronectin type-III domain-containing protein n=1 Tax=Pedobacter rhizosphaerae TaxID=390241 RepID=A0A1H9JXR4_9SPHI|nr:hypothetical protein [Pedobacter rhizosphaerae]SEQ91574.1 hypothetical protein SAMN04488023_102125 [Pedobacter rhizosphaerae]
MERYKWLIVLLLFCSALACKKQTTSIEQKTAVENLFIELITSRQIDINYNLSHLGYESTGITYYKKADPASQTTILAIREKDRLALSLQSLTPNSEYVFKIFYKINGKQITDVKEYTLKTLTEEAEKYAMVIKSPSINYDEKGNFTIDIEGENLQNINLSQLEIKVNLRTAVLNYPTQISGAKYKLTIKGIIPANNMNYAVQGYYQGKEIFFQSVPFIYDGDRYWMSLQLTSLRGYAPSVFNNELYYFFNKQVTKWNDPEQRLVELEGIPDGTINPALAQPTALEFDGKLFFSPLPAGYLPDPEKYSEYYSYPQGYAYQPGNSKWSIFAFKDQHYPNSSRIITNSNYFVHKGELYLTYSIVNDRAPSPMTPSKIDNYLYHYNKSNNNFERRNFFSQEIKNYHFISINNQLYLLGLVPVFDQGFKVSATFAIFRVTDNFSLEEYYKGGTLVSPESFTARYITIYDQKILMSVAENDFRIFDLNERKLYPVYFKNNISNVHIGNFFLYNNKHHLFADQKNYEISIQKGR